ncbi:MAG: hypothetical protein R3B06_01365 [Kofleriaceae bacterium]
MLCRRRNVQGRITNRQLPLAEKSFPGIGKLYRELADGEEGCDKPATFLQLLWIYEGRRAAAENARASKKLKRRR